MDNRPATAPDTPRGPAQVHHVGVAVAGDERKLETAELASVAVGAVAGGGELQDEGEECEEEGGDVHFGGGWAGVG